MTRVFYQSTNFETPSSKRIRNHQDFLYNIIHKYQLKSIVNMHKNSSKIFTSCIKLVAIM